MSPVRDVVTIDDLSDQDIEAIFQLADSYLETMAPPATPDRIRGKSAVASGRILATLFAEPSTRTRFSFESAMLRLGGQVLGSSDIASTSFSKGETIADAVRVVENYADLIVIRSPLEGAARVAADFASVPVINAGDGSHEHPTQTLCDLYTLRRQHPEWWRDRNGRDLNVLIFGDLKNGRTIHSLVYALARFGAHILAQPAPGLSLPSHVQRRLRTEYQCELIPSKTLKGAQKGFDAVYVTNKKAHQRRLFSGREVTVEELLNKGGIDAFYVTRFQAERTTPGEREARYPVVNTKFLKGKQYKHTSVLHPLPRVEELGYDLDQDPRGVYFKQAAFGVPVRMALIAYLLELDTRVKPAPAPPPLTGLQELKGQKCANARCVSNNPAESRHLVHRFHVVVRKPHLLRCVYCENEIEAVCKPVSRTRRL